MLEIYGDKAKSFFIKESGGHRWQRIPPTEKSGRVHTSTITIAVMDEMSSQDVDIKESDLYWEFIRGTGKGGQHPNKTCTCVRVTHVPTGISAKVDSRSQPNNKKQALEILVGRLNLKQHDINNVSVSNNRKSQVGSGQRGDKIRTIRVRDDVVTNNISGKKISFQSYEDGDFQNLNNK